MNQRQANRIKKIIEADADLRGYMWNEQGETCAVGGLAAAAGFDFQDENDWVLYRTSKGWSFYADRTSVTGNKMMDAIFKKFPFLEGVIRLSELSHINDSYSNREDRHKALLRYIDSKVTKTTKKAAV